MEMAGGSEPAAAAVDAGARNDLPGTFQQDPIGFLSSIATRPPSHQLMVQLGGAVGKWFDSKSPDRESSFAPVAAAYLQAAAVQLREVPSPGEDTQVEVIRTMAQYEIVRAVGICATLCKERRGAISSSGILPTLGHMMLNGRGPRVDQLSVVAIEFLQCALVAEEYQYASRLVSGTWHRPDSTVNAKQVLRYYYLRGMIHLGCNDYIIAHRCFWTCLCVPAEVACKTVIEALKKLVLVQCIMNDGGNKESNGLSLPKSTPTCIGRMITSATGGDSSLAATSAAPGQLQFPTNHSQNSNAFAAGSQTKEPEGKKEPADPERLSCYIAIVNAFYAREKAKLEVLVEANQLTLKSDGNMGLVQQCHTQLVHNQVRHLSKIYSVISCEKLAALLSITPPDTSSTQQHVSSLLVQSGVSCEIHDDGMIEFGEPITVAEPLTDLADWISLQEEVQRLGVDILTNPRYQSLIKKETVSSGGNPTGEALAGVAAAGPRGVDDL